MPGNVLGCILDDTISDLTEILLYWGKREQVKKQAIRTHCEKCMSQETEGSVGI